MSCTLELEFEKKALKGTEEKLQHLNSIIMNWKMNHKHKVIEEKVESSVNTMRLQSLIKRRKNLEAYLNELVGIRNSLLDQLEGQISEEIHSKKLTEKCLLLRKAINVGHEAPVSFEEVENLQGLMSKQWQNLMEQTEISIKNIELMMETLIERNEEKTVTTLTEHENNVQELTLSIEELQEEIKKQRSLYQMNSMWVTKLAEDIMREQIIGSAHDRKLEALRTELDNKKQEAAEHEASLLKMTKEQELEETELNKSIRENMARMELLGKDTKVILTTINQVQEAIKNLTTKYTDVRINNEKSEIQYQEICSRSTNIQTEIRSKGHTLQQLRAQCQLLEKKQNELELKEREMKENCSELRKVIHSMKDTFEPEKVELELSQNEQKLNAIRIAVQNTELEITKLDQELRKNCLFLKEKERENMSMKASIGELLGSISSMERTLRSFNCEQYDQLFSSINEMRSRIQKLNEIYCDKKEALAHSILMEENNEPLVYEVNVEKMQDCSSKYDYVTYEERMAETSYQTDNDMPNPSMPHSNPQETISSPGRDGCYFYSEHVSANAFEGQDKSETIMENGHCTPKVSGNNVLNTAEEWNMEKSSKESVRDKSRASKHSSPVSKKTATKNTEPCSNPKKKTRKVSKTSQNEKHIKTRKNSEISYDEEHTKRRKISKTSDDEKHIKTRKFSKKSLGEERPRTRSQKRMKVAVIA